MTQEQDSPTTTPARFYTLTDAAAVLNVDPSTLSRHCASGNFPHVRIGRAVRIPVAEVERLERGEPMRSSLIDVPDYETGTPSMFDAPERPRGAMVTVAEVALDRVPEADSPEDTE